MAEGRISIVKAMFLAAMLPVVVSPQPVRADQAAEVAGSPIRAGQGVVPGAVKQVGAESGTGDEMFGRLPSPAADRRAVPEPRPDAVLVRWRPAADAGARARDLRTAGGRAVAALPGGWTVVRGNASTLRERLQRAESVARVEPDLRRRAAGEDVLYDKAQRSALEAVRWPEARPLAGTPAADLVVAVVDTGVAANHPDLAGRVLPGYDATSAGAAGADDNGHGTAVAGVVAAKTGNDEGVAGVASGVSVLPVKVLNAEGYGYDSDIAEGIRWAADHGADVINMSLAGLGSTTVLAEAVAYAHARGAVLVAAVGNGIGGALTYPASYPDVLSVGATTGSGDVVDFSQWNEEVDLVAPGVGVVTTYGKGSSFGYVRADGTSFAAALVSGAAALLRTQQPTWTMDEVAARLTGTARDAGPPGRDRYYGWGLLDMAAAVGGPARPVSGPAARDAFEPDDAPARAHPPGPGQFTYASLSPEGDVDWWRFQVAEPAHLFITLDWSAGDDPGGHWFRPSLELYDPSLQRVRAQYAFSSFNGFAATPGTYYLRVSSAGANRILGPYNLQWSLYPATDYGFRDPERYYGGVSRAMAMALADVTGDGRKDVVVARASARPVPAIITVLEQQPDGELPDGGGLFTPPVAEYPISSPYDLTPEDMSAGDVDGDGDADLAVATVADLVIARQDPGGLTQQHLDIPAFRVLLADVTGDGIADLITTEAGLAPGTYVRAGGAGGFGPPRLADPDALRHLVAADVDVDGDLDLVGATSGGGVHDAVHVLRQGGGAWSVTSTDIGQGKIGGLGAGPLLDGGGAEVVLSPDYRNGDVEVRTVQAGGSLGAATVLDPTPAGTFQTPNAGLVRLVDVTGDGRLDVAAFHNGWGRVEIAPSTGTGFGPSKLADLLSSATPRDSQLQLGDVNGDQKADVVQSSYGHPVTVLAQRSSTRPPRAWVRDVAPADGATGLAASVTPRAVLARTPAASSITAQSVRLVDATSGGDVPATRTWSAALSTLSVDPIGPLASGHTYELVLSGLVDEAGVPMVLGTAFERGARSRFTVGSPPADSTAPDTVVREAPDGPAAAFLADATEPGTTFQCAGSADGPWGSCNDRSTWLRADPWTSQTRLHARAVDGGGRADPTPASLVWDDRGVERPANDFENTPTPMAGASGAVTGTTVGASGGGGYYPGTPDYDPVSGASVFYRWTATASGRLALSTEGSDFDTVLSVTRDEEGAKLARDDDVSAVDRTSRVSVQVVAGHSYLVRVAGFQLLNPRTGAVRLAWSFTPAENAPPAVAWSSPAAGAVLHDSVQLVATASDDIELAKVEWLQGTTVLATDTDAPWSQWISTRALADGPTTLTARATDADGATASANRSFVIDNSDPVTATPTVSLEQGGVLGTSGTVPVVVRWTSTDTGSGVASHTIWTSVDGGPWGSAATVPGNSVRRSMTPGHSYRFRVQATDRAGHAGNLAVSASRRVALYQDTSSTVTWTTRWTTVRSTALSGGSARYATIAGERARWKPPTGIAFAWVSRRSATSGVADVYVDGLRVTSYDLRSSTTLYRRLVVARAFSPIVAHTVDVRVRGTAGRPRVDVDAFVLLR
jgi:subtilisin family serine protease